MGVVPHLLEDIAFGIEDSKAGCLTGVYEKVDGMEAELLVKEGYLVSSAFTL